jgi:hypothetical protein
MELKRIFSVKIVIKINYFWMFYALCNKVHNFGTFKHHGTQFINRLFVILIILHKLLLNVSLFKNSIKMTLFDISNDFF